MDTTPPLPPEIWERTPPEAQAYILHLAARVATLETTVQALLGSCTRTRAPPRGRRRVILLPASGSAVAVAPVGVGLVGNPGTVAKPGR